MAKKGVNVNRLTMSPTAFKIKRRATPQQWKQIRRRARRRGVTVDALLDQTVPKALKERTRASLQQQATSTIRKAYAPAELSITQREGRVKAVDEKRARDNQYYNDWLRGRSDQLRTASQQADGVLRDTQQQIAADSAAATAGLRNEMMQAASAQPGNVSDPNQAKAFDTSDHGARNNAMLAAEQQATNQAIGSQESRQATLEASNFAMIAASEAKRTADTWTKLSELSDERGQVQFSKAADAAKEVARLLDQETAKAESNREFKAVAQRLGIDLASIGQRERASKRTAKSQAKTLAERRANNKAQIRLERRKQNFKEGLDLSKLQLDEDKLDFDKLKNEQKLDLDWYKAKHGGKSGKNKDSKEPQDRFEYGYALVATSVFQGKPRKDGTYPNKKYQPDYVAKNYNLVVSQLVNKGKFGRRMAETIVNAFIRRAGSNPGNYNQYTPSGYSGSN